MGLNLRGATVYQELMGFLRLLVPVTDPKEQQSMVGIEDKSCVKPKHDN